MKKSLITFALIAGLGIAGYYGYQYYVRSGETQQVVKQPQIVDVITVQNQKINPEASFVAKISSPDRVGLRARVSGFLQEKLFNEGEIVQKGQPLFIIEKVNFEARVRQAEAN
jgi:multidrug efflux pump subunit AcrA (membrane-fusion protein)